MQLPRRLSKLFSITAVCVPVESAWKCNQHLSIINMAKYDARRKQLDSFRDSNRKLKLFLLDHPFYSLNEFFRFEEDNRTSK